MSHTAPIERSGSLAGRVALLTGVSRRAGIGAALAAGLAGQGTALYLTGWPAHDAEQPWGPDDDGPAALVEQLRADGADVHYDAVDLADPAAPTRLMAAAVTRFGGVDFLLANHARSAEQSLWQLTATELDACFAVNARATLLLTRAFAEHRTAVGRRPGGRVVYFTSGQYHGAMPAELPYIASKAVLHELTASVAVELAPLGITVNCVDPGPNDTGYATGAAHRQVEQAMPMGRWGQPGDAARLVGWLVGDDAGWVTGQTIASDGGWSSR